MTWLFSKSLMDSCGNSHCSRGQAEESSEESCLDGEPFAELNVMPTAQPFWRNDKTKDTSNLSRFGLTSRVLTERDGEAVLTSFLAAFHVRTSALQEEPDARGLMEEKVACGARCSESLMRYDPDTHSLKTRQLSLFGGLVECSAILPRFGSMQAGECFLLPMLEHDTSVKGYGLQEVTGTPIKTRSYRSDAFRSGALSPYEICKNEGGVPRIEWLEHLMGWPIGWTDLRQLEMDKFQQWLHSHGNFCLSSDVESCELEAVASV